jgi:hypothetical protein
VVSYLTMKLPLQYEPFCNSVCSYTSSIPFNFISIKQWRKKSEGKKQGSIDNVINLKIEFGWFLV